MARKLIAAPGRPRVTRKVEQLIVRLAEENRDWGYDRIAGGAGQIWDIVYAIRRSAMSRDALDGVADGVIDNPAACKAKFDPATTTYTAGGATFPLQLHRAKIDLFVAGANSGR